MHPGFEKDYRYLLSALLPRQYLSQERLESVETALASGFRSAIVRESWMAMEELADAGFLARQRPSTGLGQVILEYRSRDGKAVFELEMGEEEYAALTGSEPRDDRAIVPSIISGIISSLNLNGSGATSTEKLESILDLAEHLHPGVASRLVLFSELDIQAIRESERVRVLQREEVESDPLYAACLAGDSTYSIIEPEDDGGPDAGIQGTGASAVLIPLRSKGTDYGILEVHVPLPRKQLEDSIFNLFLVGQGIIRLVDNNRHLEQMVSVDPLTRVNNRNYYETQLPLEMERAVRNRKSLGFLIMDIDDFKSFNDLHGHDTGDEVLRMVAGEVRNHLRKIDLFFRFGGEEFIALLPGADREASERTAERIREVVSKKGLETDGGEILRITITIGGCVYPSDADNEKDLFRKADRMLLSAKEEGKNRVKFYDTE